MIEEPAQPHLGEELPDEVGVEEAVAVSHGRVGIEN